MQGVGIGMLEVGGLRYTFIVLILITLASWFIVNSLKKASKRAEEAEQREWEQEKQAPGKPEEDK